MASKETGQQKETVERVMHEFKHGELRTSGGSKRVRNPKQAVAIALSEAGASNRQTPEENDRRLRRAKTKERRGETGKDAAERRGR